MIIVLLLTFLFNTCLSTEGKEQENQLSADQKSFSRFFAPVYQSGMLSCVVYNKDTNTYAQLNLSVLGMNFTRFHDSRMKLYKDKGSITGIATIFNPIVSCDIASIMCQIVYQNNNAVGIVGIAYSFNIYANIKGMFLAINLCPINGIENAWQAIWVEDAYDEVEIASKARNNLDIYKNKYLLRNLNLINFRTISYWKLYSSMMNISVLMKNNIPSIDMPKELQRLVNIIEYTLLFVNWAFPLIGWAVCIFNTKGSNTPMIRAMLARSYVEFGKRYQYDNDSGRKFVSFFDRYWKPTAILQVSILKKIR